MKHAEQTTMSTGVLSAFRSLTVRASVRGIVFEQLEREQITVVVVAAEGSEGVRSISSVLKGYTKSDIDKVFRKRENVVCESVRGRKERESKVQEDKQVR